MIFWYAIIAVFVNAALFTLAWPSIRARRQRKKMLRVYGAQAGYTLSSYQVEQLREKLEGEAVIRGRDVL